MLYPIISKINTSIEYYIEKLFTIRIIELSTV